MFVLKKTKKLDRLVPWPMRNGAAAGGVAPGRGRGERGGMAGVPTHLLAATALAFFAMVAMAAIEGRARAGLPDILVDVALGGKMKINTANGPMLVTVGDHMKCPQCQSLSGKGVQSLAACPCSVPVGGMKDGVYYTGVITVKRTDKDDSDGGEVQPVTSGGPADVGGGCETKPLHLRVTAKGNFLDGLPVFAGACWRARAGARGCNVSNVARAHAHTACRHARARVRAHARTHTQTCTHTYAHTHTHARHCHDHMDTGDAKTEAMLQQLLKYFGPDPENGLIVDGTLTCKQEWDMMHPDYLIPKPGYPSDIAVSS